MRIIERCESSLTIEKIGDGLNRTPDRRARPEWRVASKTSPLTVVGEQLAPTEDCVSE